MGSRGLGGFKGALMGSVSDSAVRYAHCPVMVVRRPSTHDRVFGVQSRTTPDTDAQRGRTVVVAKAAHGIY